MANAHFRVWRGDRRGGELEDFSVAVNEGEVVLDVIFRLQATQTPDLAVRWNCKAGKCGSCSAEINGLPRLMCMTRMSSLPPGEPVTVTPLRTFPVIKDLVTDVSYNYEKAKRIPAFRPRPREADGTYRMQQQDIARGQEFRKCIECWMCQNVCHVIRDHEENKPAFAGPRFFIRLSELDMHPLDTNDRKRLAQEAAGLGMCNITKCCTEVCPEHIKITDNGIIPLKERVVDMMYDPVFLGAELFRRAPSPALKALDRGDPVAAEQAARARLADRPSDRPTREVLEAALLLQGRFADASEATRETLGYVGRRRRRARMEALDNHAWALLCAVESGQLPLEAYDAEIASALAEAQRLASTGRNVIGTRALHLALRGQPDEGVALATEALSWQQSPDDRANNLLTFAVALADAGHPDEARAALEEARQLDSSNPRIPAVEKRVLAERPV
jgi:succinate dehydrogenase / fumarate reductase, iron-sulfur subunit